MYSGSSWPSWSSSSNVPYNLPVQGVKSGARRSPSSTSQTHAAKVHFYKDDTTRLELIRTEAVVVTMEDEPFASGGVCEAHRIWLIRADGEKGPMQVSPPSFVSLPEGTNWKAPTRNAVF